MHFIKYYDFHNSLNFLEEIRILFSKDKEDLLCRVGIN